MNKDLSIYGADPLPTRYSLLSRLENWDDNQSWKDFFDTYWRLIYSVALKAGLTESEAQEVVQETIICVANDIHKFKRDRQRGSFKGWLRNLTRWRIADQLRKRTVPLHPDQAEPVDHLADPGDPGVAEDWDREWQWNLFQAALDHVKTRVDEEQYQVFDFYVIQQWPVSRITRTLGVSAARVYLAKHRISRLIEKEVRRLEKEWNRD